jgi:PAS domain S-box-containing protein
MEKTVYVYGKFSMKRDATGKFLSNWNSETKRRVSVTLTDTAWRLLDEAAQKFGISRSEVIERTARSFAATGNFLSKAVGQEPGQELLGELNSYCQSGEWSKSFDLSRNNVQSQQHRTQFIPAEEFKRRVAATLESITDAFVAFDRNWRYTYVNQAAAQILQKTPAELLGKHVWNEVFPELIGKVAYQQLHRAVAEQVPVTWEEFEPPLQRWLEVKAYPSEEGVALYFRDVTERRQAEQALRNTAERLRLALAAAKLGDWSWDAATDIVTFSERAAEIFGIPPGPYMTWTQMRDLLYEDDRERARIAVDQAISNHSDYSVEYRVQYQGISERWIAANGRAHYAPTGEVLGMLGVVQDITQRKQLEAELQEQKQQFKMLAENAPDIIARFDAAFRHLYVSPSVERATGLPATAFIGKTNVELGMPEALCGIWHQGLERVFTTGQEHQIEFQFLTPQGLRWYQSRLVPESLEDGTIESVLCVTRDFDDYKQTEQALRQSEERLRFALESAEMVAWEWNPTTGQVVRSHNSPQVLGIELDSASKADTEFFNLLHPEDRDTMFNALKQAIAQKSPYCVEFRIIKPDGSLRWMFDQGRVIYDDAGAVVRMSGVIQDITERKQVESALRESELKFRTLADIMPQFFWITHPDGYHEYFNQRWFEYTGLTPNQSQGWNWHYLLHPDDRQRSLQIWQESLRTGNNYMVEHRLQRACDGAYRWFLVLAFPLRDPDGQILKWFGSCTDIHDQRCLLEERDRALAQEQAARQQAEAANQIKDEFLAVLSHELRTPLNPILGWARLLRQGKLDATTTTTALETIERNARLQTQLIDDLLDISRILQGKLSLNSSPVDLKETITAAIETVRLAAEAKRIQLKFVVSENLDQSSTSSPLQVLGDAARLQQVIWNLLTNAVKFTPSGGQVSIHLDKRMRDEGERMKAVNTKTASIHPPSLMPHASFAQITVTDTGKGIRPEFLPYIFDTFRQADSTTTRTFGGLGLGLAIVRRLVELHGGYVCGESAGEGQGATFTVTLPLMPSPISTTQGAVAMTDFLHLKNVHILAIDDDTDNLELLQFILEQAGATVITASSAIEALKKMHQSSLHLIIADIAMPEVNGYTLIQQIRELPPEQGGQIPAIALTAYGGESNQQQALTAGFQRHLTKPVEPDALVQAISELLHQI